MLYASTIGEAAGVPNHNEIGTVVKKTIKKIFNGFIHETSLTFNTKGLYFGFFLDLKEELIFKLSIKRYARLSLIHPIN